MKEVIIKELSKITKISKKEIESLIEIPKKDFGDFAFPTFQLAKTLKKNPSDIAKDLAKKINLKDTKIEPINAYVNFYINKEKLAHRIIKNKKKKQKKGKIIVEHTSINPNASPHMGRIRNSLIGDSIVRILKFSGHDVRTHYYVNDVSKQIAMLVLICNGKEKFKDLIKKYQEIHKKIKKNPKLEKKVFDLLAKFEKGDSNTRKKFKKIVDIAIKGQKSLLKQIGIEFDFFDYESKFLKEQGKIIKQLEKTGKLFKDKDNRQILRQEELKNMMKSPVLVLTRNDNTGLYPLRDIAYTKWKMKKGDNLIILGEDQKLYFKQIKSALNLLNLPSPIPIHYSFVLIQEKGKTKKMATRKGDFVLLEDFLEKAIEKAQKKTKNKKTAKTIALAAIKYSILRNAPSKNIIFNLDESLKFEGNTGPYLLYSYARASSIIRKSKKKTNLKKENVSEKEIKLLKKINEFSLVLERANQRYAPNLLANYSYELAKAFNEFYHTEKVIKSEKEEFKLAIIEKFRETLKESLSLLGINVLEKM